MNNLIELVNKKLDEYDKAYILAYKDFLKEKMKEGVTNE